MMGVEPVSVYNVMYVVLRSAAGQPGYESMYLQYTV
jgi:hypothetical protein